MSYKSDYVVARIVPGHINVVIGRTDLYHIPCMVHIIIRYHMTQDAAFVQQIFICFSISLAHGFLLDQNTIQIEVFIK